MEYWSRNHRFSLTGIYLRQCPRVALYCTQHLCWPVYWSTSIGLSYWETSMYWLEETRGWWLCSEYFSPFSSYRPVPHLCEPVFVSQYCLFSVMSDIMSYLFMSSLVLSSQLRLGRLLLLFPITTISIIFSLRVGFYSSIDVTISTDIFCLKNFAHWYTVASSSMTWFLT